MNKNEELKMHKKVIVLFLQNEENINKNKMMRTGPIKIRNKPQLNKVNQNI